MDVFVGRNVTLETSFSVRGNNNWGIRLAMTTDGWIFALGSVGGFCTTFAYVPQVIKIWKQGGRDLSYGMLGFICLGWCCGWRMGC
jgi:hypothetical protein